MPRDSGGTHSLPAGNPVTTGTAISSTWANDTLDDLSDALTDSLSRSGDGGMTAPLQLDSGLVGTPSLTFSAETSLGLYRVSAGQLGIAVGGSKIVSVTSTGATVTGTLSVSGVTSFLPGTAALPGITFTGDTNTGISAQTADLLVLSTTATQRMSINSVAMSMAVPIFNTHGTALAPSYVFVNDTNTGMSAEAADTLILSTGGTARLTLTSASATFAPVLLLPNGSLANPAYSFSNFTSTGMNAAAGPFLVFSVGGGQVAASSTTLWTFGVVTQHTTIELGHASDTTLSRSSAGVLAVEGKRIVHEATGSFTGTITGCAVDPTGTVEYVIRGTRVTLYVPDFITGTGDTTAMTMTGLPAAVVPARAVLVPCHVYDNTANANGQAWITAGGNSITFFKQTSTLATTNFTASGGKGLNSGWQISYELV